MASDGDLAYALKLLASGQTVEQAWVEAGFGSRKALADRIYELAEKAGGKRLKVVVYSDGASSGNPGDAGCGVIVLDESGATLLEDHRYLGRATNNVAEYEGAILALKKAADLGASRVELRVDSSLLANQIKGRYRVKDAKLANLYQSLMKNVELFEHVDVTLVRSEDNRRADRLANLAIAAHRGRRSGAG